MKIKRFFEDFVEGQTIDCGTRTLSRDEIVAFAEEFDPQPFHLDETAAKDSLLGGLAASGWHTCATMMRMMCDAYLLETASEGGPGVDEVRWRGPVSPDTPLSLSATVLATRASKSKPAIGIVSFEYVLTAADTVVCTQRSAGMIRRRGAAPEDVAALRGSGAIAVDPSPDAEAATFRDAVAPDAEPEWLDPSTPPFRRPIALGEEHLDADRIMTFARAYDPQPMHTDPAAAAQSLFGGLCASGWHTGALWMRRHVASRFQALAALPEVRRQRILAALGPSPGFHELQWRRPVFAGDTLRFYYTPMERRALNSRPGWSVLTSENTALNQHDQIVLRFKSNVFARSVIGAENE